MCEMPTMFRQNSLKARKNHRCCECSGFVKKGELYQKTVGVWCGDFSEYKTCQFCADLRKKINEEMNHEDQVCFGELAEFVNDSAWYGHKLCTLISFLKNMRRRGAKIHRSVMNMTEQLKGVAA